MLSLPPVRTGEEEEEEEEERGGRGDHECLGSCIATGTEKKRVLCMVGIRLNLRTSRPPPAAGRVHATYRKYRRLVVSSLHAKHGKFACILERIYPF